MNMHPFASPAKTLLRYGRVLQATPMVWLLVFGSDTSARAAELAKTILDGGRLDYKVGFLGIPSSATQFEMSIPVPWTQETVGQLKKLGFNTIQLNVA